MPYAAENRISQSPIEGGIEITEEQYQQALAALLEGLLVSIEGGFRIKEPPPPPDPEPLPDPEPTPVTEVTAAQGGIALINAGLMPAVQAAVDDPETPAEVRWAWERATTWERTSPALAYLADKAGISSEQMDDLFEAAAQIQA